MIKIAVIGTGSIGRNHVRVYAGMQNVELLGISDVAEDVAAAVSSQFHIPFETDYRHLLDKYKPDLVSICVPTNQHYEVGKEVIARGIHLLIEKPIAETVAQANELIKLADAAQVKLTVGHIERFNPAIVELKRQLDNGKLSKVFRVQTRRQGPFPSRIRDVGVVIDLAPHDLDIIRYVLKTNIQRLYAETAHGINTDREDIMDAVVHCENGVIGTLNINWMTPTKIRECSIIGAEGMFVVNFLTQELYFYENDVISAGKQWEMAGILLGVGEGNMIRLKVTRHEPLYAELEHFVNAVIDNTPPLVSGEDGLHALALAQGIVKSGLEHRIVTLDELL